MLALATSGCVERRVYVPVQQPAVVQAQPLPPAVAEVNPSTVISQPPPVTAPVEVVPVAPGPDYVWTPGYWSWQGHWVWIGGTWVIRPRPHMIWVGGHWAHHPRGWMWERGHWR